MPSSMTFRKCSITVIRWTRVERALKDANAVLVRHKRHAVFRLPNGRNFVMPSSPSDHRAEQNALKDLQRALKDNPIALTTHPRKR